MLNLLHTPVIDLEFLPVDPELLVGVIGFAVLFVAFGLRPLRGGASCASGCSEHGCGPEGCATCTPGEPGEFADDGNGVPWRFVDRGSSPRSTPRTEEVDA